MAWVLSRGGWQKETISYLRSELADSEALVAEYRSCTNDMKDDMSSIQEAYGITMFGQNTYADLAEFRNDVGKYYAVVYCAGME